VERTIDETIARIAVDPVSKLDTEFSTVKLGNSESRRIQLKEIEG
jgi:hypothetical protein